MCLSCLSNGAAQFFNLKNSVPVTPLFIKSFSFLLLMLSSVLTIAAQFDPPAAQPGSKAIHKDSANWVCWANQCTVQRGWLNIANPALGFVSSGLETDACGTAGEGGVVSLGDAGFVTLQFPFSIRNGDGPDFVVFENAFNETFLELAFVEVSSDGTNFVRFPSISNSDTSFQIGTFGAVDATKIYNLAGKYRSGYGTPFDLEELKDSLGIDLENITHVRIVDVVGSILPDFARRDSRGIVINDPWTTPFNEGGFDLDAVGVLNAQSQNAVFQISDAGFNVFPNPVFVGRGFVEFDFNQIDPNTVEIFSINGEKIIEKTLQKDEPLDISKLSPSTYIVKTKLGVRKLIVY